MLTELFLNSCFSLVLNKNNLVKKDKTIYRDILDIILFFKSKQKNEIPINLQNKLDCLTVICKLKIDDKTDDNIIDSISHGEKFKSLLDFITVKRNEELPDEIIYDNISQIKKRKKLNNIISNYDKMSSFLDTMKSGNYDSIDSVVSDYEKIIKEANFNLIEANRDFDLRSCATLDLLNDDYNSVLDMIKQKYDKKNTIHTGYNIFDNTVFDQGGFEKSRLYIFAGGSGSGKSTLMLNFINNDIIKAPDLETTNKSNTYIYITLENQVDESFMRLYQMMFKRDTTQTLRDINTNGKEFIKNSILEKMKISGCNLIFKFFPKYSISCSNIVSILDDVIDKYGKDCIRALYVDYLDLLKSDRESDIYRLELGYITSELKDVAIKYNIPLITASQLGRESYKVKDASNLSVAMISEAIKKVENADFICIMAQDQVNDSKIYVMVGKNRCGKNKVHIDFNVNFKHYKFVSGTKSSNDKKPDVTTDQLLLSDINNDGKLSKKPVSSFPGFSDDEEKNKENNYIDILV